MTNPEQPGSVPGSPVPPADAAPPAGSVPPAPAAPQGQPAYPAPQTPAPGAADPAGGYTAPAAGYPAAPGYAPAPAYPAPVPGRGLAIVGFVLAFLLPLIGMIISIVATVKLRRAGAPSGLAISGIIIGAILTIVWIVVGFLLIAGLLAYASVCAQYGPGVWQGNGLTITCG